MLLKQINENVDVLATEIWFSLLEKSILHDHSSPPEKDSRKRRNIIRIALPYEVKFRKVLQKLFKAQKMEVLANMEKHPSLNRHAQIDTYTGVLKQDWMRGLLFAEMIWRKRFEKSGKPFIGGVIEAVGQAELTNIAVGIDFDIQNLRVLAFIGEKLKAYSKDVNDTTLAGLRKTLRAGVSAGESIPELQERVQHVFEVANTRAVSIARTEVISSANKASLEAYRQSGVVEKKEWISAADGRTRPSHQINGQKVGLDEMFTLGSGVKTDGPGQSGVAEEDINCRCTTGAIVKE